jgi:hypothetical protein
MADQGQRATPDKDRERRRAPEPPSAVPADPQPALPAPVAHPIVAAGNQATGLADRRWQAVQRQALAAQIARVQGNRALGEMVARATPGRPGLQRTPVDPATLAATSAAAISPLGRADMRRFTALLAGGNYLQVLDFVKQVMVRRGEVDRAILATQAVPGHQCSDCEGASLFVLDTSVNGANTVNCGNLGTAANPLPNPRIRVNFDSLQSQAVATPRPGQGFTDFFAALIHSTLLHEFRHVRQEQAGLAARGGQESGVCTDCNHPDEMDAYLSEIEAGYNPHVYRHAWVRVYTNWDYLAPVQQAVFAARRTAAQAKIERAFPGVDWPADPDVVRYRARCQEIDRQAGGNTRGRCNSPLAPLAGAGAAAPAEAETPETSG